jgi:hypothetical protein
VMVSPGCGSRATRATRSRLTEPKTMIIEARRADPAHESARSG